MLDSSRIWLNQVANPLSPDASLVGSDIDIGQCPPSSWIQAKVSFRTWNIFEDPPADLVQFNLIHLRQLNFVIPIQPSAYL